MSNDSSRNFLFVRIIFFPWSSLAVPIIQAGNLQGQVSRYCSLRLHNSFPRIASQGRAESHWPYDNYSAESTDVDTVVSWRSRWAPGYVERDPLRFRPMSTCIAALKTRRGIACRPPHRKAVEEGATMSPRTTLIHTCTYRHRARVQADVRLHRYLQRNFKKWCHNVKSFHALNFMLLTCGNSRLMLWNIISVFMCVCECIFTVFCLYVYEVCVCVCVCVCVFCNGNVWFKEKNKSKTVSLCVFFFVCVCVWFFFLSLSLSLSYYFFLCIPVGGLIPIILYSFSGLMCGQKQLTKWWCVCVCVCVCCTCACLCRGGGGGEVGW